MAQGRRCLGHRFGTPDLEHLPARVFSNFPISKVGTFEKITCPGFELVFSWIESESVGRIKLSICILFEAVLLGCWLTGCGSSNSSSSSASNSGGSSNNTNNSSSNSDGDTNSNSSDNQKCYY